MTFNPGQHVYLAAPFFNDAQRDLCTFIEEFETSSLLIYSPRKDGGVLKPDASDEDRERIFSENVTAIEAARWTLAVIDDFDTGVLWEMGYAYAKGIPILGYSDVEGRGLNVMLAGACALGFANGRASLGSLLRAKSIWGVFPRNTWAGEIQ